jgi:hypothetical protein
MQALPAGVETARGGPAIHSFVLPKQSLLKDGPGVGSEVRLAPR